MDECMPSLAEGFLNQTLHLPVDNNNNNLTENNGLIRFGNEFSKLHGPLSLAVCAFGIPANLLNIIVLTRRELAQTATNHLLLWLAFADLLLMVMYAPCLYHFYIHHPHPMKAPIYTPSKYWIVYLEIFTSSSLMFHSLALWLAVILALFRYIHVGFPVIGGIYTTRKRAFLSAILTTICCIFITIPNILVNHIRSCYGPVYNPNYYHYDDYSYNSNYYGNSLSKMDKQIYYFVASHPYDDPYDDTDHHNNTNKSDRGAYQLSEHSNSSSSSLLLTTFQPIEFKAPSKRLYTFNVWIQSIATKIAPTFLLTILTILLIGELQKAIRRRRALLCHNRKTITIISGDDGVKRKNPGRRQQSLPFTHHTSSILSNTMTNDEGKKLTRENRTTALLLTIVIFFLIIELPQGILVICLHLIDNFEQNVYQHVGDLLDFLTLLNESISFVIYTTMSHQFRRTFYTTFCPLLLLSTLQKNKTDQIQENTLIRSQQHQRQHSQNQQQQHQQQQEQQSFDHNLSTDQKIHPSSQDINNKLDKGINFSTIKNKNDNNTDKTINNNTIVTQTTTLCI